MSNVDVSNFLKELHSQVLEQMLECDMVFLLGTRISRAKGNNNGNSRNGAFPKTIQTDHGLSIERLILSLFAK